MYRAPSKRRQIIQRTAVYSAMTMIVIAFVSIAVLLMLGFRFNKNNNEFQQGGLVQFSSRPGGANITIGQAKLGSVTPTKITVNPGDYTVTMNRDKYQPWQKDVSVTAGKVLWLNYAQLVPNDLQTTQVATYKMLHQAVASPDGQYVALLPDAQALDITTVKIDNEKTTQTKLTLPPDLLTAAASSRFTIDSWSSDSDYILVKQTTKHTLGWYLINRRHPEKSVNLSRDYDSDFTTALFDPRNSQRLFIRTASGDVRLLDNTDKSLSTVLVRQANHLSILDNQALFYIQKTAAGKSTIGYLTLGTQTGRVLADGASENVTHVAAGTYFGDTYLAATANKTVTVYKLDHLPQSSHDASIAMTEITTHALPASATHLSVRSGGRFVVIQSQDAVSNYDIELDKFVTTNLGVNVSGEMQWLDRYHLYYMQRNTLQVMEFDGANRHAIASASAMFDAVQSHDAKFIYSFHATKNGYALQRTQMILN